MSKRKKISITAVILLLAALPICAIMPLFTPLDGEFRGAEQEVLVLEGERYALCSDHDALTHTALLGKLYLGGEVALIFRAMDRSGDGGYVHALTFKDGAYYKRIDKNP